MIAVLLPNGGGDYRGIGLLDPIWKVVEKVMVARFSVIKLHDCLHGGLPGWGTGNESRTLKGVATGHEARRSGGWGGGDRGPLADVCDFVIGSLGEW